LSDAIAGTGAPVFKPVDWAAERAAQVKEEHA
jgi:hypothetical protein